MKRWLVLAMVLSLVLIGAPALAENSDNSSGDSQDNPMDSSSGMDKSSDDSSSGTDDLADDSPGNHSKDSSGNESANSGSDHPKGMDDASNRTGTDDSVNGSEGNGDDMEHRLVSNATALENEIHTLEQEHAQEVSVSPAEIRDILEHRNDVQVGVDSFLLVKNQMGLSGPDISVLAQQFNASLKSTAQAEERIRKRDALTRIFVGGDDSAASVIDAEVSDNQMRIQELNHMLGQCTNCSAGVKTLLQQQIQTMEQEQTRLSGIAQKEHSDNGLFGWMFG